MSSRPGRDIGECVFPDNAVHPMIDNKRGGDTYPVNAGGSFRAVRSNEIERDPLRRTPVASARMP
jgi:hypothetical protein